MIERDHDDDLCLACRARSPVDTEAMLAVSELLQGLALGIALHGKKRALSYGVTAYVSVAAAPIVVEDMTCRAEGTASALWTRTLAGHDVDPSRKPDKAPYPVRVLQGPPGAGGLVPITVTIERPKHEAR